MVLTSFLIEFLSRGASEIATQFGLNHAFGDILTGVILFFIIGSEFFITYKLHFRGHSERRRRRMFDFISFIPARLPRASRCCSAARARR